MIDDERSRGFKGVVVLTFSRQCHFFKVCSGASS